MLTKYDSLVAHLDALSDEPNFGFRFLTRDAEEHFHSFGSMREKIRDRAATLQALDFKKGDRVVLILPEPEEFVLTFFAVINAGLVPVPLSPLATFKDAENYVDTVEHVVRVASARAVVCMNLNVLTLMGFPERCPEVKVHTVEKLFAAAAPAFHPVHLSSNDLCFLQFTSGSTSKPKGVMVTHGNLIANAHAILGDAGLRAHREDNAVSWLPLYHDMGLIGFALSTIIVGVPATFIPTESFARSPRIWLEALSKYRGTITYAPNFAYGLVAKRIKDSELSAFDLSSVRVAGCGAEPIRARTVLGFAKKFEPCGFRANALLPSYGMAEATLAISFHQLDTPLKVDRVEAIALKEGYAKPARADDSEAQEMTSCGPAFPGHEIRIVNDKGEECKDREVGEITLRGPSITSGYFENPEATAESWKKGWLHTGDLGYFVDGNLYICGRIKDLIIIRGANHYPQDIEWAIEEIEGVRRGNVIAFSVMNDGTEELVIVAEAKPEAVENVRNKIPELVMNTFALATSQVALVQVNTLPKTSSGKVQRRKTKSLFEEGKLQEYPQK